jgi:molecular chaperone GrpE (heat shock protein)
MEKRSNVVYMDDIKELKIELEQYLDRLLNGLDQYNEAFLNSEYTKTSTLFAGLLEGFQWVNRSLQLMQEEYNVQKFETEIKNQYIELLNAMEAKDEILIKDILLYEIKDSIEDLKLELASLS